MYCASLSKTLTRGKAPRREKNVTARWKVLLTFVLHSRLVAVDDLVFVIVCTAGSKFTSVGRPFCGLSSLWYWGRALLESGRTFLWCETQLLSRCKFEFFLSFPVFTWILQETLAAWQNKLMLRCCQLTWAVAAGRCWCCPAAVHLSVLAEKSSRALGLVCPVQYPEICNKEGFPTVWVSGEEDREQANWVSS